jgi:hypothetical protein
VPALLLALGVSGLLYCAGLWKLREPLELRSLVDVRRGRGAGAARSGPTE